MSENPDASSRVWSRVAPVAPKHAHQPQADLSRQTPKLEVRLIDHVAAGFRVLRLGETLPHRPGAPAHAVPSLDHPDIGTHAGQIVCRGQPGESRARHQYGYATQIAVHGAQ